MRWFVGDIVMVVWWFVGDIVMVVWCGGLLVIL